jgi:hypothetical protein
MYGANSIKIKTWDNYIPHLQKQIVIQHHRNTCVVKSDKTCRVLLHTIFIYTKHKLDNTKLEWNVFISVKSVEWN